ncbi:MAG: Gfo/Idh/MocA family oxidoreductase, partial [Planctomycetes bacterium]|nr:Gfo/Idh/MocA family oxidoreductase [Planctomycetota bacterium]
MTDNLRSRPLRMAMIGGGPGSGIGEAHRRGARLDGQITLVSGAFSSTPEKSRQQGEALFLPPDRVHGDWRDLIKDELQRPAHERADFFSIVTPNHLHYEPTREALLAGFHVVMDKPMTMTADEARDLAELAKKKGRVLVLTHTYVGYPMVRLARDLIKDGRLGKIRKIHVEYLSGWLSYPVERENNKQASWRTDPALAGAGCLGDIGTHAAILAETVTGLRMEEIAAEVTTFVDGRGNDDNVSMLV